MWNEPRLPREPSRELLSAVLLLLRYEEVQKGRDRAQVKARHGIILDSISYLQVGWLPLHVRLAALL
jgi:hypothetical protein